jgi:hypothetical protein
MRKLAVLAAAVFMASARCQDSPKLSRADYLQSKIQEAARLCHENIVATAKDPGSLQFTDSADVSFGRVVFRDSIYVTLSIMGRNTYGAVLRHSITCRVVCQQGHACSLQESRDDGG